MKNLINVPVFGNDIQRRLLIAAQALTAFVGVAATPNVAMAGDPHYQYSYFNAVQAYGPGSYTAVGSQFVPAGATVVLSPSPSLTLNSQWVYNSAAVVFQGGEEQWMASVVYQVTVNGPTAVVPIDVTYSMSAVATTAVYAIAQAQFNYDESPNYTYLPVAISAGGFSSGSQSSGGTIKFNELAGTTFYAGLSAVETLYGQGDSAAILIDPVYTIDPSFALTDPNYLTDYSLTFTDNVQNVGAPSPIPAPGSLPLLASALVGLWIMARFRHPLTNAAVA